MFRIIHTGDIHMGSKPAVLADIIKCCNYLLDIVLSETPDLVAICGDLYDEGLQLGSPGSLAAIDFVQKCARIAPTVVIRGTTSHDAEGSINPLDRLRAPYPIFVTDKPGQILLTDSGFKTLSSDSLLDTDGIKALLSLFPTVTKGNILSFSSGTMEDTTREVQDLIRDMLGGWGVVNDMAREEGIPSVLLGHGTILGSQLSTGQTMVGRDMEVSVGDLALAKPDLCCYAHIHKRQALAWPESYGRVFYSGSITRLNFGEAEEKGFYVHEISDGELTSRFIETPARVMRTKRPEGLPGIETVADVQAGELVRIVYTVSEMDVGKVDEQAIIAAAIEKGAVDVKIEKVIVAAVRVRAEGISKARTLEEKLLKWAETAGVGITREISEKLEVLERIDEPAEIVDSLYNGKEVDREANIIAA